MKYFVIRDIWNGKVPDRPFSNIVSIEYDDMQVAIAEAKRLATISGPHSRFYVAKAIFAYRAEEIPITESAW